MAKRSFAEICRVAKKAAEYDVDTDQGYIDFRALASREGINHNYLIYYTNAYEAAEESGVRALSYKKRMPEDVRHAATQKIERFLLTRLPKDCPDKLWFRTQVKDNRIILSERRPYFMDNNRTTTSDFAQLRYTDYDKRWHLYWKRASGKWWPYVPGKDARTVDDCIREITNDGFGCFWG